MIPAALLFVPAFLAASAPGGGPSPIRLDAWLSPGALLLHDDGLDLLPATPPPACECASVAFVAWRAQLAEATDDFLVAVAKCINDGGGEWPCSVQLLGTWRDARAEAADVRDARLEVCQLEGGGRYDPQPDPQQLTPDVTNPYLPWVPDRVLVYRKVTAEGVERTRVQALGDTVEIAGFLCRAVRDVVRIDGDLLEDTLDWYAQDPQGNVWYLGELAENYEDGRLHDLAGSWETGRDQALPGLVMKAAPQIGDFYRQEFLLGEAEDVAMVVSVTETVTVPHGTFTDCVAIEEWTPLEPGVKERKYYAAGIGLVLAVNLQSGERAELVRIIEP